jgi:thioredoxin 1
MRPVTDASFEEDVLRADRPVVVDFWAPWCGPCKAVTRALEEVAGETDGIEFVMLDIDENPVIASRYEVLSIPTVILFADGRPSETVIGAAQPRTSGAPSGVPPSCGAGGELLGNRCREAADAGVDDDVHRAWLCHHARHILHPENLYVRDYTRCILMSRVLS